MRTGSSTSYDGRLSLSAFDYVRGFHLSPGPCPSTQLLPCSTRTPGGRTTSSPRSRPKSPEEIPRDTGLLSSFQRKELERRD